MYNSIYPVNINYSNKYRKDDAKNAPGQNYASNKDEFVTSENNKQQNTDTFPNGTKVAVDYTKGQINISQVLADFKNTIIAINAPDDIKQEVGIYLGLVEKESKKEAPSKDIITSNLKNAAKISDSYIAQTLGKQSNVVEGWIKALFMQKINLKADESEINPDFALSFPQKAQEKIEQEQTKTQQYQEVSENIPENKILNEENKNPQQITSEEIKIEKKSQEIERTTTKTIIETPYEQPIPKENNSRGEMRIVEVKAKISPYDAKNEADKAAKALFSQAKKRPRGNRGDTDAVNLLNEALGILSKEKNANPNIKAAIHLERGKIFDTYDYVDYALKDYRQAALGAQELNLKAQAHYKTGSLYDEFNYFNPALDNYLSSVAYSGEADNLKAQTFVLSKIAGLYTKKYDVKNTQNYANLALENANVSNDQNLIAKTYSSVAQNYQYLGKNENAIDNYKHALAAFSKFSHNDETYEQMAHNYEQAALVMKKLGNHAKAEKLQLKASQYYQKAQQTPAQLAEAS